jgi:hypothetical protein
MANRVHELLLFLRLSYPLIGCSYCAISDKQFLQPVALSKIPSCVQDASHGSATVHCDTCQVSRCAGCEATFHRGALDSHKRRPLQRCQWNPSHVAQKFCVTCQVHLCDACQPAARQSPCRVQPKPVCNSCRWESCTDYYHKCTKCGYQLCRCYRPPAQCNLQPVPEYLEFTAQPAVAQPVASILQCARDPTHGVATRHCAVCAMSTCEACNTALHAFGQLALHKRVPILTPTSNSDSGASFLQFLYFLNALTTI